MENQGYIIIIIFLLIMCGLIIHHNRKIREGLEDTIKDLKNDLKFWQTSCNRVSDQLRYVNGIGSFNDARLIYLAKQHKLIMENKNIIISVYTNASGFIWSLSKVDSGTDLGWSGFYGNTKGTGTFKSYHDALEDAITLINKCDLDCFEKATEESEFHWGNYATFLNKKYR